MKIGDYDPNQSWFVIFPGVFFFGMKRRLKRYESKESVPQQARKISSALGLFEMNF